MLHVLDPMPEPPGRPPVRCGAIISKRMQKISDRVIFWRFVPQLRSSLMRFRPALFFRPLLLAAALSGVGGACLAAAPAPSSPYERIYVAHCAVCHGEHGDGRSRAQTGLNPPPRDFTSAQAARELTRERMIHSVTFGRPGTAMVPWGNRLRSEEIAGVVDFIRARFMQKPAASGGGAAVGGASPDRVAAVGAETAGTATAKVPTAAGDGRGAAIYRAHCSTCHGDKGAGTSWAAGSLRPPPRDFTAPGARAELTLQRMLSSVTHGRPGTAMMAFGSRLSADDIQAVVAYIRSEFMGSGTEAATMPSVPAPISVPAAADMSAAFAHGLRGDAGRGEAFYMQNCRVCHGERGDGRGPRAGFIQPPPRDFLSGESRQGLNRPALFTAIANGKRGTVMPAWKTVLDEQQIADVAEFVFSTFVHPSSPADGTAKKKVN